MSLIIEVLSYYILIDLYHIYIKIKILNNSMDEVNQTYIFHLLKKFKSKVR